ncbi:hypothetical protein [Paenibacillus sp. FSL R7-269]|uniref:hypothetical protein n=1 Tax=Paenibacillus sp. FSL R7-269 TaxID=1226755 RepID=UPI0012EB87C7|nr:hypothetical protein [Paenibacillus sp. FSL R7-269]
MLNLVERVERAEHVSTCGAGDAVADIGAGAGAGAGADVGAGAGANEFAWNPAQFATFT